MTPVHRERPVDHVSSVDHVSKNDESSQSRSAASMVISKAREKRRRTKQQV